MWDTVGSLARDYLLPLLTEAANMMRGVPKEAADMKDELERIEELIHDAVRIVEAEEDNNNRDRIKTRVKQMIEVAFRIEDDIDEYMIRKGQQSGDPGCAALARKIVDFVKTLVHHFQLAAKIKRIKLQVGEINEIKGGGFQIQPFKEPAPSISTANRSALLRNLREAPLYLEETEVVGFEGPRDELIGWMVNGRAERTVISLVGMGGLGKTTLAKKVFDNHKVIGHFKCHAWITVSQSYTVEGLLRDMLHKFSEGKKEYPDRGSLIDAVRNYLQQKRYVILFDDVWDERFWQEFEFALVDNNNGSRIFMTTRNMNVAVSCMRSSFVEVHELQPLPQEKSLELFYKKAFFNLKGRCPENLTKISFEIVKKCRGLPLAIVAIGGLLSRKNRDALQWQSFSKNLSSELDNNPNLTAITKIVGFSYHYIPFYLKRCLLYFGIYPEDYEIRTQRLIRQWIAEGFVKQEQGKTLEEVAEEYLTELTHRNLVQVFSVASDGKIKSCRVHDMVREMILDKIQHLSFCHFTSENEGQSVTSGMIRHLTIATISNNLMESVETSNIRSLHVFRNEELPNSFLIGIPSKYRLLKVLDFEDFPLYRLVPINLGDLFHLRYLSFRNTKVTNLPESIGMLQNLETLDIRETLVREMPREINKLRKLRHLLAYYLPKDAGRGIRMKDDIVLPALRGYPKCNPDCYRPEGVGYGIRMKDGIGDITALQTLHKVEADHGGVEQVRELERLAQLRKLGLTNVKGEYSSALCSSINKMQHLEKLYIAAIDGQEVLDLQFDVSAPVLRKLQLEGKLNKFPYWVRKLQNLVMLSLSFSKLTHDPLTSMKDLPNLLYLDILYNAYEGECLHFPDEGFKNLKQLVLGRLYDLNSICIGEGALCSLQKFKLVDIPRLKKVPSGLHNLLKLKSFCVFNMSSEFIQNLARFEGQYYRDLN